MLSAPINQAFSTMSAISFFTVLIPLPWYLEHWNMGMVLYMGWTATALLIKFIDSIVWAGNALDSAPIWCEITSRIMQAVSIAIPTAALCIMHRMYRIARFQGVTTSDMRRRMVVIDLSIGLGIPLASIPLYWVIQGGPYEVLEDFGCTTAVSLTPMSIPLYAMWPLIIGSISGTFGSLATWEFLKRRSELKKNLASHRNLTSSQYFRHIALAAVDIVITIPVSTYYLHYLCTNILHSWDWTFVHTDFFVITVPAVLWRSGPGAFLIELDRWIYVLGAFIFFVFFGFSEEARKQYGFMATSASRALHLSKDMEQSRIREQSTFNVSIPTSTSANVSPKPSLDILDIRRDVTSKEKNSYIETAAQNV